jgi:hypothetical protein
VLQSRREQAFSNYWTGAAFIYIQAMVSKSIRRPLIAATTATFFLLGAGAAYAREETGSSSTPSTSNAGVAAQGTHATAAKKHHTAKVKHAKKSKAHKAKKAKKHAHRDARHRRAEKTT